MASETMSDHSYHCGAFYNEANKSFDRGDERDMFDVMQENRKKQELIKKMLDQQRELRALQERQRELLKAQQQFSELDYEAETELNEKLKRLEAAKAKISKLQNLIKVVQDAGDTAPPHPDQHVPKIVEVDDNFDDCARPVNQKLDELNSVVRNLLKDIDQMELINTSIADEPDTRESANVSQSEHGWKSKEYSDTRFGGVHASPLPVVKLVGSFSDMERSSGYGDKKLASSYTSTPAKSGYFIERHDAENTDVSKITPVKLSPREETEQELNSSAALNWEMKRQQLLLKELSERRSELEALIKQSQEASDDEGTEGVDVTEQHQEPMSLNETNVRRLIENMHTTSLDGTTQKTTATWGSSSASSVSQMENLSFSGQVAQDADDFPERWVEKSTQGTQTQFEMSKEFEAYGSFLEESYKQVDTGIDGSFDETWENSAFELWEALERNSRMLQVLMDDQHSLSALLQNTINVRNGFDGNSVTYGISPDFLIYQLDNCSAQIFTCQKNITFLQHELNKMQNDHPDIDLIYGLSQSFTRRGDYYADMNPMRLSRSFTPSPTLMRRPLVLKQVSPQSTQPRQQSSDDRKVNLNRSAKLPNAIVKERPQMKENEVKVKVEPEENDESIANTNPLFEGLRDSIYSEAATLISQNESRPHFLIELFHELQRLNSDYLRQHCLYVVRDIVSGYLTESPRARKSINRSGRDRQAEEKGIYSENTPSESMLQSDDNNPGHQDGTSLRYDYALDVSSGSELSTPIASVDVDATNPFAADYLGSTVVYLDEAMQKVRDMERIKHDGDQHDPGKFDLVSRVEKLNNIDAKLIDTYIKAVMAKIIPILKSNDEICTRHKIQELCVVIVKQIGIEYTSDLNTAGASAWKNLPEQFHIQLATILLDTMGKYRGVRLDEVGEDLMIDVSEVLFNELAFLLMMNGINDAGDEGQAQKLEESSESSISDGEDDSSRSDSSSESSSLSEEDSENVENKSGNTGKDSLVVDLSVSESKPLTSYGSGEDEEGGSGEEYVYTEADIPTSIQRSDTQREQPPEDTSQEAGSVSPSADVAVKEGNKEEQGRAEEEHGSGEEEQGRAEEEHGSGEEEQGSEEEPQSGEDEAGTAEEGGSTEFGKKNIEIKEQNEQDFEE